MHNSLKRAVSIAIAAIALFSLPCGSIFARTHIDIDKKCSITVDIPDTWEDLYTVDFPVELYRVADVDENDVYTATKQFDELAKSISDISSKTTADDWEKMAKTAADIADKGSLTADEVIDVSKFGLLFAGAQKNLGPAGVVLVIAREDLIGEPLPGTPTMLTYKTHADAGSLYNTPPTYAIYIFKLVLEWIKSMGGIAALQKINEEKAAILYDFLDSSKLFKGTVVKEDRSLMNVPFVTGDDELDAKFVKEAKEAGLVNLKGHRTVGGMRASIYNAMPIEGVKALVEFMKKFEQENS